MAQPNVRLETAQHQQFNGNYDEAIVLYQDALAAGLGEDQERLARFHLAETYKQKGDLAAAAVAWEGYFADYPDDGILPQARLMAARTLDAANECVRAIPHYEAYLNQQTALAGMIHEWIGDCHSSYGEVEQAYASYRQALEASSDTSTKVGLHEKIASAYLLLGDFEAAIAEYDAILGIARNDSYRAKIEYLAGQAIESAGRTGEAQDRYLRSVDRYPKAEYAYLALVELVDAGIPVDEFQRGLVDYFAGSTYPDAYGAAIRAFDRYLAAGPAAKADEALYRKALAQRSTGLSDDALSTLETIIEGYPHSTWLAQAWYQKAITLRQQGHYDQAVKVYQDVAAFFPADDVAPKALEQAAELRLQQDAYAEAAALYENLQASFPAYEDSDEALWRAGLARYHEDDLQGATASWQNLAEKYPGSPYRPKSLFWLGKLADADQPEGDDDYWDQLVASAPHKYYGLRVEQIRAGESLTSSRMITAPVAGPAWDAAQNEAETLTWLEGWTSVPTGTKLTDLPPSLASRLDLQRGKELLAAGLRREALAEFDSTRGAAWDDPVALAQLAFYFREQGLDGMAARAAIRLAALWPDGGMYRSPLAVQRLAYPLSYTDLMSADAGERGLDPLLLAALIRQESLFEPQAESYAGARGLGQVMPATGKGIANVLEVDGYQVDDLYRPSISVRFAAYYLALQLGRFDDQLLVALAAYNGGPGNTLRWLELGGEDLDLFVERITATQSRLYLQRVYEHYVQYETLYRYADHGP